MNQQQKKYLDNRIQTLRKDFWRRIDNVSVHDERKTLFESSGRKMWKEYEGIVSKLDKRELAVRLVGILKLFTYDGEYDGHDLVGEISDKGIDAVICDCLEVDDFIKGWNERTKKARLALNQKKKDAMNELDRAVMDLRDKVNLGDAEEALAMLKEFSDEWEKTVSTLESGK